MHLRQQKIILEHVKSIKRGFIRRIISEQKLQEYKDLYINHDQDAMNGLHYRQLSLSKTSQDEDLVVMNQKNLSWIRKIKSKEFFVSLRFCTIPCRMIHLTKCE